VKRLPLEIRIGRANERAIRILQSRGDSRHDEARERFRDAIRAIPDSAKPRRRAQLLEAALSAYDADLAELAAGGS
jgi:hypothetical protein